MSPSLAADTPLCSKALVDNDNIQGKLLQGKLISMVSQTSDDMKLLAYVKKTPIGLATNGESAYYFPNGHWTHQWLPFLSLLLIYKKAKDSHQLKAN